MPNPELVWENDAARNFDWESEALYVVISDTSKKGEIAVRYAEWFVIKGVDNVSDAFDVADLHAEEYPEAAIRILKEYLWGLGPVS